MEQLALHISNGVLGGPAAVAWGVPYLTDKRDYVVSNEKIERTGFCPAFSLDDGIRELIKAFTMIRNTRYSNV